LGTVAGLQRFVTMHDSPYHGLNFCQGTVAEMLDDPGREIFDVIRWFGARGKLFNVHFRNIRGGKLNFMEVFPDEGDMDMTRSLQVYQEVGYQYMIMPDHVPERLPIATDIFAGQCRRWASGDGADPPAASSGKIVSFTVR
jgi:mannonate dehydratase